MALNDPKKKRDEDGTRIGHLTLIPGSGADRFAKGVSGVLDNLAARNDRYNQNTRIAAPLNTGLPSAPAVARPAATPVRSPVVSTVGGGGSTPTGGTPASPPVVKPNFAGVQGSMLAPPKPLAEQPTGITRSVVNGVPTFTGTGDYAAAQAQPAPAVQRPTFTDPRIAPVSTPGIVNQTEDRGQRDARQAALGALDLQDFLLRGKTTRSARDAVSDNARVRADLVNTAGNQAVALKNNNLDNQSRLDAVGLQNQGENDRAVVDQRGQNERALLSDTGDTERTKLALSKPETLTGADGSLLSVSGGLARPVVDAAGNPVKMPATKAEGQITPQVRLESLVKELEAAQSSLTPDPVRISQLTAQVDALRGGNSGQQSAPSAPPKIGATQKAGDGTVYQFTGGDPADPASWKKVK